MCLAVQLEVVHFGAKDRLDFRHWSAEPDLRSAVRHPVKAEALRLKPRRYRCNICWTHPKLIRELLRREPLVVIR